MCIPAKFLLSLIKKIYMYRKANRLLKIYSLLKRGPVTIETIKQWARNNNINISERTFYRDLNDLEDLLLLEDEKIVVKVGEKNKKVWKIEYAHSSEELNEYDINSYLLFKSFLPLPVLLSRKKSLEKIENLFYTANSKSKFENFVTVADSQIISSHFFEGTKASFENILDDVIWSIQNKREIRVFEISHDYTSISPKVKFPTYFLPLQLLYHRGIVHLAGLLKSDNKLLIIALEQLTSYKLTNNMFESAALLERLDTEMRKRFGITENKDDHLYDIEIEFSKITGAYIRNQFWHPTQDFEILESGNIILKMKCGINRELVGWIFQWMSNAKVRQPQVLKDMVLTKMEELLHSYKAEESLISNNSFRAN